MLPPGRTPLQSATAFGVPALAPNTGPGEEARLITGLGDEAQLITGLGDKASNFFCDARIGGEAVHELSDSEALAE